MKKNRLTLYILIAMAAGIIVGYLMHTVGKGNGITYSPAKDFTGKDEITLVLSGKKVIQPIEVVKDSAAFRHTTVAANTWIVVANAVSKFKVADEYSLDKVEVGPKHGSLTFTTIQSFSDNIKLLTTIFLRL